MSADAVQLRCLSCDRLLAASEVVCLSCGGVPFARSLESDFAVVAGPVASTAFRARAAQVLEAHIPGAVAEELARALAARTVIATHVDPIVGRALIERLKTIPAEAELVRIDETRPSIARQLLGPIPLALIGAGIIAAVALSPWLLFAGLGAGVAAAAVKKRLPPSPVTQPPALPPPPPQAQELIRLLPAATGETRAQMLEIVRGGLGLVAAAHHQGLPASAAQVDGLGRAVDDVLGEAADKGRAASEGDAAAGARLAEIAASMRTATEKLGPRALPPAPEERLLEGAEVVKEIADLNQAS